MFQIPGQEIWKEGDQERKEPGASATNAESEAYRYPNWQLKGGKERAIYQ